jgi:hypothetical protein
MQTDLDMNWLKDERRIIMRMIWWSFGNLIWWMDGMDLRRPEIDVPSVVTIFSDSSLAMQSDEKGRNTQLEDERQNETSIRVE